MANTGNNLMYAAVVFFVLLVLLRFFPISENFGPDSPANVYYHGPLCFSYTTEESRSGRY